MPMPRPMPIIGPMSGEISMAPITTGVLSVFRPREATNIAKMSVSNCVPRNETPERMEASRSPLMLKFPFREYNKSRKVIAKGFLRNNKLLPFRVAPCVLFVLPESDV